MLQKRKGVRVMAVGGKYVSIDPGVEIFIQDIGSGDPIVFIPGFTFTTEVFEKQVEYFSKTNRVIVMDPRSHGRSSISLHGNDYVTHGTDLAKIISILDLKNVVLAGWSFGCLTVWEYIKQQGLDNVKSVIIIDMPPKSLSVNQDDWVEGPLDDMAATYNTYLRNPNGHRDFISNYITHVMVQRKLEEAELNWLIEQSLKTPYYVAANLFASGMFSDYREEAKISGQAVPVLTVVAEHWANKAVSFMKKISPESKVEVLGGHLMFWEYPEEFNNIIDKFINQED